MDLIADSLVVNWPIEIAGLGLIQIDFEGSANSSFHEFGNAFPEGDSVTLGGAWSLYPYLPSGTLVVSDIQNEQIVLKMR